MGSGVMGFVKIGREVLMPLSRPGKNREEGKQASLEIGV
jgi:hypothetical protein